VRALWAVGWAALCAGCVSRLDLTDLDRLERSLEARTVALEEHYTLWSPFATAQTQAWIRMIDEELAAACELFGTRPAERLMIGLVPVEGLGFQFSAEDGKVTVAWQREHPLHGVAGMSGGGRILVYVTPDQEVDAGEGPVIAHRGADDYRGTLRHELAHVLSVASGLTGPPWFYEGLADLVQSHQLEEGRLVDRGPSFEDRLMAIATPADAWGLKRLLDWREDGAQIAAGKEAVDKVSRALCGWFVRFLFERDPRGTLHQSARAAASLSRSELLALEPQWRNWLSLELADDEDAAEEPAQPGSGNAAQDP
jgi:hypothetical protein